MPTLPAPIWQLLAVVMAVMSIFLFCMMGIDKLRARRGRWRISERALFVFALLFGAVGGTAGMFVFHHKTRHWYFRLGGGQRFAQQIADRHLHDLADAQQRLRIRGGLAALPFRHGLTHHVQPRGEFLLGQTLAFAQGLQIILKHG